MWLIYYFFIIGIALNFCDAVEEGNETDGDTSRKILGSSVVTSVSVVMDTGNGKKTIYTDAVGKPQAKPLNPSELASPIDLLNPDRYEFYTFNDNGDLVKRLMSLEEIKSIIATGDSDAFDLDSFTSQGFFPEKKVSDVVNNVQSVLKEEMEILKDPIAKPIFDTPDVSDSWSMILPAIFGNSGEDIKPNKPIVHVTPDTFMFEPNTHDTQTTSAPQKFDAILSSSTTINNRPNSPSTYRPSGISTTSSTYISQPMYYSSSSLLTTQRLSSTTESSINVEIFTNSMSVSDPDPTKQSVVVEEMPLGKKEPLPTRPPALNLTMAPLIHNVIKPSISTSTTVSSSTDSTSLESLLHNGIQTSDIPSENYAVTPIDTTSSSIESLSSQLTSITEKTTQGISSSTISPTGSILTDDAKTASHTSETTLLTSESPLTLITSTSTKLTIKPELNSSNTISNIYSTIQNVNNLALSSTTPHFISTIPVVTSETNAPDLVTEEVLTPVSTQKTKTTLPSIKTSQPNWTPTLNDVELFNIFKETIAKGATKETVEPEISGNLTEVSNTESLQTANTYSHSPWSHEYLSTLSTDNIDQKLITSTNKYSIDSTTKLPPLLNSLSDNQKISASELLDQLLLTTNIYEINTELASPKITVSDTDERFETFENKEQLSTTFQYNDNPTTTTEHDFITYPPTTDITLMHSIEKLISQAVSDIKTGTIMNEKVEDTPQDSTNRNMVDLFKEVTTEKLEMSNNQNKSGSIQEFINSTEDNRLATNSINTTNDNLGGSVTALLSQVYENTASLHMVMITEKPNNGITYRKVDSEHEATTPFKATTQKYVTDFESSSEDVSENITQNILENSTVEDKLTESEATTYYYVTKRKVNNTQESPMINITIISSEPIINRTKPAKADLSLEQELIAEEIKNIALMNGTSNNSSLSDNIIKPNEDNSTELGSTGKYEIVKYIEQTLEQNDSTAPNEINKIHSTINMEKNHATEEYISTSDSGTTTDNIIFLEVSTTGEIRKKDTKNKTISSVTEKNKQQPKPSIVITINENNTVVTENGKLVANKTIFTSPVLDRPSFKRENISGTLQSVKFIEKNSNQDQTWTLVSTVTPQHLTSQNVPPSKISYPEVINPPVHVDLIPKPMQGFGLEETTSALDNDVYQFTQLCNELAFGFWKTVTSGLSSSRSIFVSPFAAISMLAMVFLGAKGATSEEMNEILKLDDMVTFNPHLIFKNVSESVTNDPHSGVAITTMIKELFSDRSKGKLLDFYKNRVKAFYDGYVEEVGYREIGDVIRRRTNLLIKKYTNGKYSEFLKDSSIKTRPPLSGISINIFETDCSQTSMEGRDGELHFVVLPSIRQRRLVPIPAVVYNAGFLAGYEPSLDATAVSIGTKEQIVSTILVIPGQQGIAALGDGLARLEKRLVESSFKKGAWSRLLRSLVPRPGLEVQIPRFTHRSIINATNTLQRMGLHELFNPEKADLRGLNGVANELHLSDVLQINSFATCGDGTHHSEIYPATTLRARAARYLEDISSMDFEEPRDYQRAFHDPLHDPSFFALPLSLRPRQARIPEIPRLRFDRPFLYFIRHNPTGLILHMGRFNPRLLP